MRRFTIDWSKLLSREYTEGGVIEEATEFWGPDTTILRVGDWER